MKVLWLCNVMLPMIARHLGQEASSKEGWISGMADAALNDRSGNRLALSVAFPMPPALWRSISGEQVFLPDETEAPGGICRGVIEGKGSPLAYYGFPEDTVNPEKYEDELELVLKNIVTIVQPDVVHCFGTEYPHTLAMCRIFPRKDRLLVGLQGLCTLIAKAYYADLPPGIIRSATFRDLVRKDTLRQQKQKFIARGETERKIVGLAGNITGRTRWDEKNARSWNPDAVYYSMNETLRREFYGPVWEEKDCIPHSIFLSQGDYPLKGLHYMLLALPGILEKYPDARVFVAGNSLVKYGTWKEKMKISAYGKYLRHLLAQHHLEERVTFLGMLDGERIRDRYLKSHLFVCCSALENSPNSLGEAMLLGMPCVCAAVGGIPSMFRDNVDGILYEGFRMPEGTDDGEDSGCRGDCPPEAAGQSGRENREGEKESRDGELERVAGCLAEAVLRMWDKPDRMREYCKNARIHALETHDREKNYRRLVEIYGKICGEGF